MTLRTSAVAASRSRASASSRVSRATFVCLPAASELRRRTVFGALRRLNVLERCVFTAFPRRLITYPEVRTGTVATRGSTLKGEETRHSSCPLWVKSRHVQCDTSCPLYTRKRTFAARIRQPSGTRTIRRVQVKILPLRPFLSQVAKAGEHGSHAIRPWPAHGV